MIYMQMTRFRVLFIIVVLISMFSLLHCDEAATDVELHRHDNQWLHRGMKYLDSYLEPKVCANSNYIVVEMGCGGGFAAHFQLAAADWLRAAAGSNYTIPVIITGKIRGYSESQECAHANKEWTCFFRPLSACQEEFLKSGTRITNFPQADINNPNIVPNEFAHLGMPFWWGLIQHRMFRVQRPVHDHIRMQSYRMLSKGFPFTSPVAGLHVRHGDKKIDGFRDHSFESELGVVKKSPECQGANAIFCEKLGQNTSDSTSHTNNMHVFVASDDVSVLRSAQNLGFLTDAAGISQQTESVGMYQSLMSHPEWGYNASLEIISDVFFLSHCSTLVGIAASQVFRMSVDMSNATGRLQYAVAVDYNQLPRIRKMSVKYGLPVPEDFARP